MSSPMTRVSALVSRDISNYLTNKKIWDGIVYNVKDYGAKVDGTTDDYAAIQTLIDIVKPTGGIIRFPEGVCLISDTLKAEYTNEDEYNPGIRFVGSGMQTTVLKYIGIDYAIRIQGAPKTNRQYLGLTFGASVEDMSIWGNITGDGGTGLTGNGIYATRYYGLKLQNVFIQGFSGNGVFLDRQIFNATVDEYSVVANLTNVSVFNCQGIGYKLGSVHAVQQTTMTNCYSQENGYGVQAYCLTLGMVNCYIGGNDNGGVLLIDDNSEGIVEEPIGINFIGCGFEGNNNYHLKIDSGRNINVDGCWLASLSGVNETNAIIIGTNAAYAPTYVDIRNTTINSPLTSGFTGITIGQYSGDAIRCVDVDIQTSGTSVKYSNAFGKKLMVENNNVLDTYGTYSAEVKALSGVNQIKWGFETGLYTLRNLLNPGLGWFIANDLTNHQVELINNFFNFASTGDATLTQAGKGIILKTPDGTKNYKITVSNTGVVTSTLV